MMMCPYLFRHKRWISWNFQHLQRLPASLQGEEWSAANWGNSKADEQAMGTADGAQCLQFMNCIKKCFTFIYILCVWMFCVCLCPWRVKGCQISWNWGYRQLWNTIWVISIKPTYSRSTIVPSLQPPHKLFQSNYLNLPPIITLSSSSFSDFTLSDPGHMFAVNSISIAVLLLQATISSNISSRSDNAKNNYL